MFFRRWLFTVACNAACRHFTQRLRQVQTVHMDDLGESLAAQGHSPSGAALEFKDLDEVSGSAGAGSDDVALRGRVGIHEIAAAKAIPIGTVQWRVFNSKKKFAVHLRLRQGELPKAA